MSSFSRSYLRRLGFLPALLSISLAITLLSPTALAWQQGTTTTAATGRVAAPIRKAAAAALTVAERKAAARVKLETIREVTTTLSSPEFEGRGTGQPGADKAARYLADRFAKLGLQPAGENGTYLQAIKFKSAQVLPETSVKVGDAALVRPGNQAQDRALHLVVAAHVGRRNRSARGRAARHFRKAVRPMTP